MRKAGDTNMGKNFNINLKEARLRAGFSQKEIAEKIGVAKSTYSLYENGHREPNICTIKKLAEFLHVSIDVLFDFQDKSTPSTALLNVNDLTDIELKNIQNSKGNKCMFFNSSLLGKRIKSLREDHDLTQKELSLMIGLTPKMISFYENNQRTPPLDILLKLAKIFEVSVDFLIGYVPAENASSVLSPKEKMLIRFYRESTSNLSLYKKNKLLNDFFPNACILSSEESELLEYYNDLNLKDKRWIMGQVVDLLKKEEEDKQFATKSPKVQ